MVDNQIVLLVPRCAQQVSIRQLSSIVFGSDFLLPGYIYIYIIYKLNLGPKWFPAFLHLWNVLGFDLFSLSAPHKLAFWCLRRRTRGWCKAGMMASLFLFSSSHRTNIEVRKDRSSCQRKLRMIIAKKVILHTIFLAFLIWFSSPRWFYSFFFLFHDSWRFT